MRKKEFTVAKFSNPQASRSNLKGAIKTGEDRIPTFEGGGAYKRTAESDLFLLAVTNMVGEDTFYESAQDRDDRFCKLVHQVTEGNPEFIAGTDPENGSIGFAQYLREEMLMRSASTVLAAEYVAAQGPFGRSVVARALQRPDEPAEILGYWLGKYGRNLPMALKRGVADAAARMYSERSALRYDGQSRGIRMGDVVEIVHPRPKDARQSALFKYLLDVRHRGTDARLNLEPLETLQAAKALDAVPEKERRDVLRKRGPAALAEAGYSWERLSGWLPGGMDAEAWESILPSMGAMALVRNLRNFDQANISDAAVDTVIAKINDAKEVEKARMFPYQVWSGYKNAPSDNWKRALGKTLDLSTQNIPEDLNGTLVVIDCSGSMGATVSGKSTLERWEVAAVMAAATVKGTKNSDVVCFGTTNLNVTPPARTSALKTVERVQKAVHYDEVGSATYGHTAIRDHYDPKKHKRVVLFTDDQMMDSDDGTGRSTGAQYGSQWNRGIVNIDHVPLVYTFNLGGYAPSALKAGQKGRYTLGGFSDATFRAMKVLESGRDAAWPFL